MAVIGTALELPESGSGAELKIEGNSLSKKFLVYVSSPLDGPITVALAPGIPTIGSSWIYGNEYHEYSRVLSYNCDRLEGTDYAWHVTVNYGLRENDELSTYDPELAQPEASMGSEVDSVPALGTFNGSQFTYSGGLRNSAGEAYEPAPTRRVSRSTLAITRNEHITTDVMATKFQYESRVNTDTFWGWAPGYVVCDAITTAITYVEIPQERGGGIYPYLRTTYNFVFDPFGWHPKIVDQGSYYIDDDDNKVAFTTDDGQPINGLLDGSGGKLPDGDDPVFEEKKVQPQIAFSGLQLPRSLLEVTLI